MDYLPAEDLPKGFYLRLSATDPRDIQLARWIKADTSHRAVNISAVIKQLLYAWYELRWRLGTIPAPTMAHIGEGAVLPGPAPYRALPSRAEEEREDANDPLIRRMLSMSFEEWGAASG